jgi:quercetin dioxygenase-like cupin family protein
LTPGRNSGWRAEQNLEVEVTEQRAKKVHYEKIPAESFGEDAPGVRIRVLIDEERDGAPFYVLRMIEIDPGGNTPDHDHPFEHENFVIEGSGQVMLEGRWRDVSQGDVIFVPAGSRHQYRNVAGTVFRFLCGIPVERLRAL